MTAHDEHMNDRDDPIKIVVDTPRKEHGREHESHMNESSTEHGGHYGHMSGTSTEHEGDTNATCKDMKGTSTEHGGHERHMMGPHMKNV